jgi:hypothetical protein
MLPETAAPREIWWTVMAVPGFLLSVLNVLGATSDLRQHWHSSLNTLAWIGFGKVTAVLLLGTLVISVGIIAMQTPEPIRPENVEAAEQITPLLMVVDGLILTLAILFWVERRWVAGAIHVLRRAREVRQQKERRDVSGSV